MGVVARDLSNCLGARGTHKARRAENSSRKGFGGGQQAPRHQLCGLDERCELWRPTANAFRTH